MTLKLAISCPNLCFAVRCTRCGAVISPARLNTYVHSVSGGFVWEAEEPCHGCGVSHLVISHEGGETAGIASIDLTGRQDCAWAWRDISGVKSRATVMYLYSPLPQHREAIVRATVSSLKRPGFGPFVVFDAADEPDEEIRELADKYIQIPRELMCGMHGRATPSLLAERVVQSCRRELERPVVLYAYPPLDDNDGIFLDYYEPAEPFGIFPITRLQHELAAQPPTSDLYLGVNL